MSFSLKQTPAVFAPISAAMSGAQTFASKNTPGNLLVAMVYANSSSGAPTSITDTDGNTWHQAGSSDISISTIFYCPSAIGSASPNTVTVHFGISSTGGLSVAEYNGQFVLAPVTTTPSNADVTQPIISGLNPLSGSLLIWLIGTNGAGATWSSFVGCTVETPVASVPAVWADNTNLSQGLFSASANMGAGPDFIGKAVTFAPAGFVASQATLVRIAELKPPTTSTPQTTLLPGGSKVGNTIVVPVFSYPIQTEQITGVTDSQGNTYTRQAGATQLSDFANHAFYEIWTAPVTVGGFDNNTVTVAFNNGAVNVLAAAMEFAGVGVTQDTHASQGPSQGASGTYTLTAAKASELIVTLNGNSSSSETWSGLNGTDIFGLTGRDEINYLLSASGTNTITGTSTSNGFGSLSIAFIAALPAATPTVSGTASAVTISSTTPGATIYYTTDGSTPTQSSTVYVGPFSVNGTVKAIASAFGFLDSAAGSATFVGNYSVPDCRNYFIFPNTAILTNGTKIYTGQTSSNHAVPGTDSRAAGAPTASGTYPQNSRTPGTYGPGE